MSTIAQALPPPMAPSIRRRMACFVYEALILFGLGLIPGALGALFVALTGQQHPLQSEHALRWFAFAYYGVYFVWFWTRRGQTLPMQTWHIRLVDQHGERVGQWRALARYLLASVWFAPAAMLAHFQGLRGWSALAAVGAGIIVYALLSYLHPQRQFWHDAVCGTRLINAQPGKS